MAIVPLPENLPDSSARAQADRERGAQEPTIGDFVKCLSRQGETIANFYHETMEGRRDPTPVQMQAADAMVRIINPPVPSQKYVQNNNLNLNMPPSALRMAGSSDEDLARLARPLPELPHAVIDADYRDLVPRSTTAGYRAVASQLDDDAGDG